MSNTLSFADLMASFDQAQVDDVREALKAGFAARATYEVDTGGNGNIQKTLSKLIKAFDNPVTARAVAAAGLEADRFMNVSETGTKRRNVYALEKLRDLLGAATSGRVNNAINRAVLTSMKVLAEKKIAFTGLVARACASDKVAVDNTLKALLARHTVSESTASTQASSTMTALEDLGVVKNTGTRQHPVYVLTASPLTERLMAIS